MKPELEPFVEQLADVEQPWVWMPIDAPPDLWDDLASEARREGYKVLEIDRETEIASQEDLLKAFTPPSRNLNTLKDDLTGLPAEGDKGYAVLFRNPDTLCDNDPETFEDFLDIVEVVNEARVASGLGSFTLVTLDAEPIEE